jgi:hypothetical protein
MDAFVTSCEKFSEFPRNIIHSCFPLAERQNLSSTLLKRQDTGAFRLLEDEQNASLIIHELPKMGKGSSAPTGRWQS